ncbi:MAG: hypothetical protein CW716_03105 [Candidatus Bathyarchaeum sp.]|nr:MAG: hypothetical protein CW716_03105 [Candidatus Bathyarchaeum sp.]
MGFYIRSTSCAYDILLSLNAYDNQIYAWGKGPSATSVAASPKVTVHGSSVIIEGTVIDVSAGTNRDDVAANFPNGLPCVSDESMSKWMEYAYMQQAKPEDVKGVQVFLKIQDPNGEYYSTYVTTDENGVFSHMWTPSIVGEYHVTVMFEGSNSYWPSEATTTFGIDQAPEYPQSPTVEEIAAESASRTIAMLPQYPYVPTAEEIAADAAQRTINMLPQYPESSPCPDIPAYLTIDIAIIVLVVVVLVLVLYCIFKKQK